MSIQPLRRPKNFIQTSKIEKLVTVEGKRKKAENKRSPAVQLILTMRDGKKLVVPSNSYHGIMAVDEKIRCALCSIYVTDVNSHIFQSNHVEKLRTCGHSNEWAENLIREVNFTDCHCTLCNVLINKFQTTVHLRNETHREELKRALSRGLVYKPI